MQSDQIDFIKGRQMVWNCQRLISARNLITCQKAPAELYFMNSEKAFDKVNWSFFWAVMMKVGFGPNLCNWLRSLCYCPKACVMAVESDHSSLY